MATKEPTPITSFRDGLHPWDRQPQQTPGEYGLLRKYLALAPPRFLAALEPGASGSHTDLLALAVAHRWLEIADAYDAVRVSAAARLLL